MKTNYLSRLAMLMGMALFTMWIGCSDNNAGSSLTADEQEIQEVIIDDADELFGSDIMGESTPSAISKTVEGDGIVLSKSADIVDTVKGYGRKVKIRREGIVVTVDADTTHAEALVTYKLVGEFIVIAKNTGSENVITIRKPLSHTMQRKIKFVRNLNPELDRKWLVSAVSMGFGVSEGGTLSLSSVTFEINGPSGLQTSSTTDPLSVFFNRTSLLHIQQNDTVRITVNITNSNEDDAPFGTIHRGRNRVVNGREKQRFISIGDDLYRSQWVVRGTDFEGVHIGVVDFFTTSSVKDTEAPYNSLAITIPYIKGTQLPADGGE